MGTFGCKKFLKDNGLENIFTTELPRIVILQKTPVLTASKLTTTASSNLLKKTSTD